MVNQSVTCEKEQIGFFFSKITEGNDNLIVKKNIVYRHNPDVKFGFFNHPDHNMERFDTLSDSESDIDSIESETGGAIIEMCKD